jgi:hypothetical protein
MDTISYLTATDLVTQALCEELTDFLGDLSGVGTEAEMVELAQEAIAIVADGMGVSPGVVREAVEILCTKGWEILEAVALDEIVALKAAIEAGDLDWMGVWIPYPEYRSV